MAVASALNPPKHLLLNGPLNWQTSKGPILREYQEAIIVELRKVNAPEWLLTGE